MRENRTEGKLPQQKTTAGGTRICRAISIVAFLLLVFWGIGFADESPAAPILLDQLHANKEIKCEQCHADKPKEQRVPMETCVGCHGDYQKLAEATKGMKPNPHDSHLGEIRCTLCHNVHKEFKLYCNSCHQFDLGSKDKKGKK